MLLVVVILVSPALRDAPIIAVIGAAFVFGLAQMVLGLTRRRRYLRSLKTEERDLPVSDPSERV